MSFVGRNDCRPRKQIVDADHRPSRLRNTWIAAYFVAHPADALVRNSDIGQKSRGGLPRELKLKFNRAPVGTCEMVRNQPVR